MLVDGLCLNVEWWDWSKHFPFALWFLPVLYITELVAWLICNKIMSKVSYVIFLLALLFLPHFLSHFSVELVYSISSIPILLPYRLFDKDNCSKFQKPFMGGYC